MLTLTEELMLLALHDEKGSIVVFAAETLPFGLGGAMLMDLMLENRIKIDGDKIAVINKDKTGNLVIDNALKEISKDGSGHDIKHWMRHFGGKSKEIQEKIEACLVKEGILRKEEHKVFLLISSNKFPTSNPDPEKEIRHGIRGVILRDKEPDTKQWVLINLVKACDLINEVFKDDERATARKRIDEIMSPASCQENLPPMICQATNTIVKTIMSSDMTSSSLSGL